MNSRISKQANQGLRWWCQGRADDPPSKDILDAEFGQWQDPLNALKKAGFDIKHDESKDEYSMDTPQGVALTISLIPVHGQSTTMR